ncbi:MAG: phosphopantothenate--cysteine ligase [Defluviitaleaceae bacterium]|nr:phosphopantothenate--cysteine ligase [Defluviitaleaceae bacterium]
MKVLITSGGTAEKIDTVRSIVNTSTGRLGCAIAEAFAARGAHVFYVCGKGAARPTAKVDVIDIDDVASLQVAITHLLEKNDVDIIIHAMAVSDYRVKDVLTTDGISQDINGKISSGHKELIVHLEKTVKIIGMLRGLSPKSIIMGFKLLDNVSHETLINTAHGLLVKNQCNFVLANDATEIFGDGHKGYLIDESRNYSTYNTKAEIAQAIVQTTLDFGRDP